MFFGIFNDTRLRKSSPVLCEIAQNLIFVPRIPFSVQDLLQRFSEFVMIPREKSNPLFDEIA